MTDEGKSFIVCGVRLGEDAHGHLSLTDIWKIAGRPSTKTTSDWRRLPTTNEFVEAVAKNMGFSHVLGESGEDSAVYVKRGRNGGTFAHIFVAIAYAEYLSPDLAVDVKKTYVRVRSGDLTLVDEILEKAEAARKFQSTRDISKQVRNKYTSTLASHGAKGAIAYCTDAIYQILLGGSRKQIVSDRKLPAKANLRDELPLGELLQTMTTEYMASERIEEQHVYGKEPCANASRRSAHFVKEAFEREREDRKQAP